MEVTESDKFLRQITDLKKKYSEVEEDVDNVKERLSAIAFQPIPPLNIPIAEINEENITREVWRVRVQNSNNDKGKRAGYRIFYCRGENNGEEILFLGIYSKPDMERDYEVIAKDLVKRVVGNEKL
jgi:mRNA-degrading endonuclease RelE of RelBE toxin-antitoxin system